MRLTLILAKRLRPIKFNNYWQLNREVTIKNEGYVEALEEKGIRVYEPEELFTSHLLPKPSNLNDFQLVETVKKPFKNEKSHPLYHERPVYSFLQNSYYPKNMQLNHAKVLTKTVEIAPGLPDWHTCSFDRVISNQDELLEDMVQEVMMFDSTQKILPKKFVIPYIGWHPVNDKMSSRVPYEVTMSWGRSMPREYGVPIQRKNMNLMHGFFRYCDYYSSKDASLLGRNYLSKNLVRQFFERNSQLTRIYVELPLVLTSPIPLVSPLTTSTVESTNQIPLPDINPFNPFAALWPKHVYRYENNFPITYASNDNTTSIHTIVELYNSHQPVWNNDQFAARALTLSFASALAQARGREKSRLPVLINCIVTDGQKFYFSVFQLNTLDLQDDEGIKNIFWHESEPVRLFDRCEYVGGRPLFSGYNPDVFKKILGLYLQGSTISNT